MGLVLCLLAVFLLPNAFGQPSLGEALDQPSWVFQTSGTKGWFGQTEMSWDGVDAARSGGLAAGQTNRMSTTITGPGTLIFWWQVSSAASGSDFLSFGTNGRTCRLIMGEVPWTPLVVPIPAGTQTVSWEHKLRSCSPLGASAAWVDQVQFHPTGDLAVPRILQEPKGGWAAAGASVRLSLIAAADGVLQYQSNGIATVCGCRGP